MFGRIADDWQDVAACGRRQCIDRDDLDRSSGPDWDADLPGTTRYPGRFDASGSAGLPDAPRRWPYAAGSAYGAVPMTSAGPARQVTFPDAD